MRVRDVMKEDVITVDARTPIMAALDTMQQNHIKRLPVTRKGKLTGLVTRSMLRDASPSKATSLSVHELNYILSKMTVEDIMVKEPATVSPDLPVEEAIWLGKKHGIGAFPVVEKGKLVGIVTESDITGVVSDALGLAEKDSRRLTIDASGGRFGFLKGIVDVLDSHRMPILSIMSVPGKEGSASGFLVLRLRARDLDEAVEDLKKEGYRVTDVT
jgi:acetoin utilization protein AcuB